MLQGVMQDTVHISHVYNKAKREMDSAVRNFETAYELSQNKKRDIIALNVLSKKAKHAITKHDEIFKVYSQWGTLR